MDQEAFRKLVSSSSTIAAPSTSSNRSFGKTHRRAPAASTSATKPTDLKPHKLKSKSKEDGYVDRAAARRSGTLAAEFEQVEALHQDFEARIAAAETEEERQRLRDQISSVGGDAKYSVLVKGLDWGLLAQNKAKLEKEGGGKGEEGEGEGDLESAYQEAKGERVEAGAKRSREEIVEAIKRRREVKTAAAGDAEASGSGFRPISFKPIDASADKKHEEDSEYKWVNGKRMRKKKRKHTSSTDEQARPLPPAEDPMQASSNVSAAHQPAKALAKKEEEQQPTPQRPTAPTVETEAERSNLASEIPSSPVRRTSPVSSTSIDATAELEQPPPAPEEDESEDEDIFADVGGWDGIPETKEEAENQDSDEEEGRHSSPSSPTPHVDADIGAKPDPAGIGASRTAEQKDEGPIMPLREPSWSPASTPVVAKEPSPQSNAIATPMDPTLSEMKQPEQPAKTAVVEESTITKPKKSKWDDLDDDKDRKRKKKKSKHH
ncbi:hypothetical protein NDA11_006945 [Ustilago hordei]|uniref:RED-like N-terminal domain-containing protein n=1 Tax=Ustilago hordei TaxID=120017 RepID=I2G158_USTHO|nr:uncharacterized protein UHO2_03336 [Ustilago hordei]KAJ1041002.1 hypothetical protein NDA10_002871 [Ustilago hordei]KAJ1581024.1 hypothetical protein NDA15_002901 [Ustilago hordei]KAJ1582705.1 hypothetical protein NDA12_001432 [Ustilago hordei]KAJ1588814.1 hypothetical protein NDA11_006945 [Ustilago hordei]KAJ1599852.1 hypothetical protein NDA14_003663 [Ustilago hordei]